MTRAQKLALLVVLAVVLLTPFKSTTVPAWRIQFVDERNAPFPGLKVRQSWQDYSVEQKSSEVEALTDHNGVVSFPERHLNAPLIARLLGPIGNVLSTGVHAGFGLHAQIVPLCDVSTTGAVHAVVYPGGGLPPSRVTLKYSEVQAGIRNQLGIALDPTCLPIVTQAKAAALPNKAFENGRAKSERAVQRER